MELRHRYVIKNKAEGLFLFSAYGGDPYIEVWAVDPPRVALVLSMQDVVDFYKVSAEPKWIRFFDEKPKIGERVLVLIDGEIHEGYLDEVDLWSGGPTVFKTVFTIPRGSLSSAQHWSWGYDPYWMPIPREKPEQLKMPKGEEGQIFCDKLMK